MVHNNCDKCGGRASWIWHCKACDDAFCMRCAPLGFRCRCRSWFPGIALPGSKW